MPMSPMKPSYVVPTRVGIQNTSEMDGGGNSISGNGGSGGGGEDGISVENGNVNQS